MASYMASTIPYCTVHVYSRACNIYTIIYTYKRVVCVCLLVCLLFIGHTRFPTLRRCLRVREQEPSRAAPHERASTHSESMHTRACRTTSQQKNRSADAFQKQNRTRAHAVVYVTAEIFKKREKENQHATSQVQFTVRLLLECLLSESY